MAVSASDLLPPRKGLISRVCRRGADELHYIRRFLWPHTIADIWLNLEEFRGGNKLTTQAVTKKLFSDLPHKLRSYSKLLGQDVESEFLKYCLLRHRLTRSQLLQDLLVQFLLRDKRNGFFVEFGATNGVDLSNTWLLEKEYGWSGILAEPARCWKSALTQNRKCNIDFRCVWEASGEVLEFNETLLSEFSTLDKFSSGNLHSMRRMGGNHYVVETVSLADLLASHAAPYRIDYMSVDTEGSEFEILKNFDFRSRDIQILTIEHNFIPGIREALQKLMQDNGFIRVFERFSLWDDWYVKQELIDRTPLCSNSPGRAG